MAMLHYVDDRPIVLTERGSWEQGNEALHPKVALLFSAHLVPTSATDFEVQLGHQRQSVLVQDVGFFVKSLRFERDGLGKITDVVVKVSDGHEEVVDPSTFEQRDDGVFYIRVTRNGYRTRCRFSSAQYHELALEVEETSDGTGFHIAIGNTCWPVDQPVGPVSIALQ